MAQVAVERQRRQEDRSAIGSFPSPSSPFLYGKAGLRSLRREWHAGPYQEAKTQKGRSTRDGSALLLIPDDVENHSDSGGRTSSEREVILRYG